MDRYAPGTGQTSSGVPRTRGDGPAGQPKPAPATPGSPHTRGWTLRLRAADAGGTGFPAHAGMDPADPADTRTPRRVPRTRGDGPRSRCSARWRCPGSPHTRGWTRIGPDPSGAAVGFPAHAGMDPSPAGGGTATRGVPRTRGDGPGDVVTAGHVGGGSPHTRGWTVLAVRAGWMRDGFPAHAGMDPGRRSARGRRPGVPRTRGDGPASITSTSTSTPGSPHTRGWTPPFAAAVRAEAGFPAHAGMDPSRSDAAAGDRGVPRTRGDGPRTDTSERRCAWGSPHTRGWTRRLRRRHPVGRGFPAHAGMDPCPGPSRRRATWVPRTRGDGPRADLDPPAGMEGSPHTRGWTPDDPRAARVHVGFPAHAGMDPRTQRRGPVRAGVPRTRGDGPLRRQGLPALGVGSPHTRGWTRRLRCGDRADAGFPAHAGMDPRAVNSSRTCSRVPRTRGDGPGLAVRDWWARGGSPHTRGWTLRPGGAALRAHGFPAHAGMDRETPCRRRARCGVPRTRGDGPETKTLPGTRPPGSPHTRGWTPRPAAPAAIGPGFPAHAGMDPHRRRESTRATGVPRTRGDGPSDHGAGIDHVPGSPHTRGWTRGREPVRGAEQGFPAHAGMDRTRRRGACR